MTINQQYEFPRTVGSIEDVLASIYDTGTNIFAEIQTFETNMAVTVHMPTSPIHLAWGTVEQGCQVYNPLTSEALLGDGGELILPKTQEVYSAALGVLIREKLQTFLPDQRCNLGKLIKEMSPNETFGSFSPLHMPTLPDTESFNPAYIATLSMLTAKAQLKQIGHKGAANFVFHPDLPLYLGQGRPDATLKHMRLLDQFAQLLGVNVLFENVFFEKKSFVQYLRWMTDPASIFELCSKASTTNTGLCIDIEHLERMGVHGTKFDIENIVRTYADQYPQLPMVLHAKAKHKVSHGIGKVLMEAYTRGIPVVYE